MGCGTLGIDMTAFEVRLSVSIPTGGGAWPGTG